MTCRSNEFIQRLRVVPIIRQVDETINWIPKPWFGALDGHA